MDDFQVENLTKAIEDLIEQWQEYSDLWAKIPDEYDDYAEKMAFEQNQSFVKEEDLRNRNLSGLERFKKTYFDKEKLITETTTENIDKQIDKLNELKDKWSNIKSDIEYEQNALIAQELLGSSLESDILDGRIKNIQSFASEYANYMNSTASAAESASRRISAALGGAVDTQLYDKIFQKEGVIKALEASRKIMSATSTKTSSGTIVPTRLGNTMATAAFLSSLKNNTAFKMTQNDYDYLLQLGKDAYDATTDAFYTNVTSADFLRTVMGYLNLDYGIYKELIQEGYFGGWRAKQGYASGTKNSRASIANVDELGNELIIDPPTHGRYTVLRDGSGVLPHNLTQRIFEVATNPIGYIRQALRGVNPNALGSISGSSTNNNTNININKLDLPNVSNVEQFVKELIHQAKSITKMDENEERKRIAGLFRKAYEENFNNRSVFVTGSHKRDY